MSWRRWFVVIVVAALVILGAAFAVLRLQFEGAPLGDKIASILNKRMRGRIAIGSVEWDASSLKKVITGGWVPVTVHDVRVWDDCVLSAQVTAAEADELRTGDPNEDCTPDDRPDPDPASKRKPRKLLIRTDLITAEIDVHAIMFGNHDLVFRHVRVHGGDALLEQTREPYPLHAYDRTIVSIVSAFYPRMKAGFRAGIFADSAPPVFDLRDIHVEDLDLTVQWQPYSLKPGAHGEDRIGYSFTARIEGVNLDAGTDPANDAYLYMDPRDPLVGKFYVRLGITAPRATVRVLDEGPRDAFRMPAAELPSEQYPKARSAMYQLGLADVRLDRLAQLPTEWPRHDFVANTLELDLSAKALPCGPSPDPKLAAKIHLAGELFSYWDRPYDGAWNLKLDATNLGPTIRTCIKSNVGGDQLDGTIALTGPFVASPKVGFDLTGVDFDVPLRAHEDPLRLTLAEVHGAIDLVNEQGYIEKTKALVRNGKEPGEIELSATFGLKPYYGNAQVEITKAIDVERFLPPQVAPIGKFLQGRLRAVGNNDVGAGFELSDFDLALGATPKEKALRVHHGRLFTGDEFDTILIDNVYVEAGRSHALVRGKVDVAKNDMDVKVEGDFPDLGVWLRRFGVPALAQSAGGGTIHLTGPLTAPKVNINTTLAGVPCIDKLRLDDVTVAGDEVDVSRMSSPGLGGSLSGSARIRIGGAYPVIERMHLSGAKLDAAKLCGLDGIAKGTIDELTADLRGAVVPGRSALDWMALAQVYARAEHVSILDDPWSRVAACINKPDDKMCAPRAATLFSADDAARCAEGKRASGSGFCGVVTASRDGGGQLDAMVARLPAIRGGKASVPEHLAGTIAMTDLPLAIIDQLRVLPPGEHDLGGLANVTLHLQGSPSAPQGTGAIQILRSWLAGGFLGDAQIALDPTKIGKVPGLAFKGSALAGRLEISGSIGTAAPYPVEIAITGHRIEVDPFVDLAQKLGVKDPVQAWASGTLTMKTELAPLDPKQAPEAEAFVELSELVAIVNHRGADGSLVPIAIRAKDQAPGVRPAVSLHVTGSSIELACRDPKAKGGRAECSTVIETPAGDIVLNGHANAGGVAIAAKGDLELGKLRPLLDTQLDYLAGTVRLVGSVGGTLAHPTYEAAIDLDPDGDQKHSVVARPVGSDTIITAPRGLVKLANGALGFTDVLVQIKDERRDDDKGDLHVGGTIALDGLSPSTWALLLSGVVPAKILQVVAPAYVAQANGVIAIDGQLVLSGKGKRPHLSGGLAFDAKQPFALTLRGARRELTLKTGGIDIDTLPGAGDHETYKLDISGVSGTLDDGQISRVDGSLRVQGGEVVQALVSLDASNIPYRKAGEYQFALTARDVTIELPGEHAALKVRGGVTVVDGKYTQDFELTDRVRALGVNAPPGKPFWESYPWLASADLDLQVEVRRFLVDDNLATIELNGPLLEVSGTPRDPRLSGSIRVVHGNFRIPGTRASFTRTTGSIDFAENQRATNPRLDITSDADYTDLTGQQHDITLSLGGLLGEVQWDLHTSTGYNKSQTLTLLFLGQNQEQLRRSLGDQSLGVDPTRVDPSTNPSQGFADQIVKDLAGDWVSSLLGSSLTKKIGLDVLRFEIGFGSIGIHVEKKFVESVKAVTDFEQTVRGQTVNARAQWQVSYNLSVQLGWLNKNYYDPAEQDIDDKNGKLVYRLLIP